MGRRLRAALVAAAAAGFLWLMLDAGVVGAEPAPPLTSLSLGALALLFGLGAWALSATGQQPERVPLLFGLALGLGGYALVRLLVF
jgi:hypothetical protein